MKRWQRLKAMGGERGNVLKIDILTKTTYDKWQRVRFSNVMGNIVEMQK
jgi:hypothetical protein